MTRKKLTQEELAANPLSHVELRAIQYLRDKARDLRGLQFAQAREALKQAANEISKGAHRANR